MTKTSSITGDAASTTNALIPSISLTALLTRRDAAVACLTTIAQAVKEYGEVGEALGLASKDSPVRANYKYSQPVEGRRGYGPDFTDARWLAHATAAVDAALWDHLLNESGLRTFLDTKARKEWDEDIEKNRTPPLTPENVRATFRQLHARRGEFFERGVIEVFRALSWDYKSNRPEKFGTRIILRCAIDSFGHPGWAATKLDDLLRAFHILDRKPEPDHRVSVGSRLWRREDKSGELADDYLRIRTFKNGNAHVYLLRADLVDELNRILANHYPDALPPKAT